ncbi:MAG: two-component system sensor histidine kinase FlrB [Polaribacter sp.]
METKKQLNNAPIDDLRKSFDQFNRLSESLDASVVQLNRTATSIQGLTQISPDATESIVIDNGNLDHANDDLKQVDDESKQQAVHLRSLIDAIPGGVVVLDPHGIIVELNAAASQLLGESVLQQPWRSIVQQVFLPDLDQGELKTEDGRQFSISTNPLGYAPGQILLLSDVTQTRQLQRTAQQNRHLMTMGKMMASLAHQIRTPLASAMLYLSQIVESNLDQDTHLRFSEKALARIKHIEKIINDMLVFAHGGQFNMSQFSIGSLLDELQEQLVPILEQRNASLTISNNYQTLRLQGNKGALLGALGNLCMNALDASDIKPSISIKIALSDKGHLLIIVDDRGCGMNAQMRHHLFDPFFTTKVDGTGLGLAVVKSVIESHEGSISVASRPRVGTRFRIQLPYLQGLKTQISNETHSADKPLRNRQPGNKAPTNTTRSVEDS